MSIILQGQKYTSKLSIKSIIESLLALPKIPIDHETQPIESESLAVLQRENAFIDAAVQKRRFLGARMLSSCFFVVFKITSLSGDVSYFISHVDEATGESIYP